MDQSPLYKACFQGKSKSQGGLDVGGLRRAILELDPSANVDGARAQLQAICRDLLKKRPSEPAPTRPEVGVEIDLPPEPESPAGPEPPAGLEPPAAVPPPVRKSKREYPIFYAGHPTDETRVRVEEKYCSCIFKLLGKYGDPSDKETKYNAYALCSSSVYKKARKLPGPGPVSCRYTRAYLGGLDENTIFKYGKAKKISGIGQLDDWKGRKAQLIDLVFDWLHRENKSASHKEFEQWLASR